MTWAKRLGFTLIELLIVIMIIGILASLIAPRVLGHYGEARRAQAVSDIAVIGAWLQLFRQDMDRFPTTAEGLEALRVKPDQQAENWKGPYTTNSIPLDPWGNPYHYEFPGPDGPQTYELLSYGADGAQGGTGENEDIIDATEKK